MKRSLLTLSALFAVLGVTGAEAQAIRQNSGFYTRQVARNDDLSSGLEPMGFTINFFGKFRSAAYVNNNGNLTFDTALATFTPFGLLGTEREIIAPFFADVDTRPDGSNLVTFGQDVVNGHRAFAANYVDVGYYSNHTDKLNSFQVVLIEREDQGFGDFDIEFNYERILWETGDASGGVNGFGDTSASVGWSNGTDTAFELPGSLVPGAFLDGGPYALVSQTITGAVVNTPGAAQGGTEGRLVFRARDGVISPGIVISGGQFSDATVGVPYSATLEVAGADPPYTWTLLPDVDPPPGLTLSQDGVLSGVPEGEGTYSFTIGVTAETEDGEATVYQRGSITIRPPVVRILTACPLPEATVNNQYSLNLAATGAGSFHWTVDDPASLPPGMGLSASGLLAGTPLRAGTYMLSLRAEGSSDAEPATSLCRLNVNPARILMTSGCMLTPGTVGVPYTQVLVAEGGEPPYRFELYGNLPLGIAMTPGGVITGTPATEGQWLFRIATIDSKNNQEVQDCAVSMNQASFSIASACPMPNGVTGVPYSHSLPGGYTWSVDGELPPGLRLSPDGSVSGTPMRIGPAHFRLLAANNATRGRAGTACSLTVEPGPLNVRGCPLPDARAGEPYSAALTGLGGTSPYRFTTAGSVPDGLRISSDGRVTGTPSVAGSYPFTVSMRDDALNSTIQACSIEVRPADLRFTTSCPLPDARAGEPYGAQLEVSGGQMPYRFGINGFLPAGLELSADGAIAGTPQGSGGRSFTLGVIDAAGDTAIQDCSLAVGAPGAPAISLDELPSSVAPAAADLAITVRLSAAYTQAVEGRVTMQVDPDTASSDGVANSADPRLTFANGQRSARFSIPAGSTSATLPVVSTGTVASTVLVVLDDLHTPAAAIAQTPMSRIFRILPAAPSVTSACYDRTDTGITIQASGLSTTRELSHAVLTIPGLAQPDRVDLSRLIPPEWLISGGDRLTIDLTDAALAYYSSALNVRNGGAFTVSVAVPLSIQRDEDEEDDAAALGEISIVISNSVGSAASVNVPRCP